MALAVTAHGGRGLVIARDEGDGIIRVVGEGLWTPEEADAHFAALSRAVAAQRAAEGHVRVLIDLRKADTQSPATAARITAGTAATYRSGDRVALVMASSLAKLHMRRAIPSLEHEMFISPSAAMTWLCAFDRQPRRA